MPESYFHRIIACLNAMVCTFPSLNSAPPSSTGVIEKSAAQQGEEKMDPTMGQTSGIGQEHQHGISAYLNHADMQADQVGAGAGATIEPATLTQAVVDAAPVYPIGIVDFNKPFEVLDEHNHHEVYEDAKILTILAGSAYQVVIIARHNGEQVIHQFDTDGDEQNGDLKVENLDPSPRTVFIRLLRDGRDISAEEKVYDTEIEAHGAFSSSGMTLIGIFPVVIPPRDRTAAIIASVEGDDFSVEDDEESDDLAGTEDTSLVSTGSASPTNPDAHYVNGKLYTPGDGVRAYRQGMGERVGSVVKTREHSWKTLFIQFNDGSNPYWALNKNIRNY
jgi:hypothetical protein